VFDLPFAKAIGATQSALQGRMTQLSNLLLSFLHGGSRLGENRAEKAHNQAQSNLH